MKRVTFSLSKKSNLINRFNSSPPSPSIKKNYNYLAMIFNLISLLNSNQKNDTWNSGVHVNEDGPVIINVNLTIGPKVLLFLLLMLLLLLQAVLLLLLMILCYVNRNAWKVIASFAVGEIVYNIDGCCQWTDQSVHNYKLTE